MTAKAWCAISKALKLIAAAQNTSLCQAQVWLIEACAAGNVRSREPWREPDRFEIPAALITVSRKRAPLPVVPTAWKGALIDKDVLVDVDQVRWSNVEISIADLEFGLKKLPPLDGASSASAAPFRKKGGRPSDKDTVATEASTVQPSDRTLSNAWVGKKRQHPSARSALQSLVVDRSLPLVGRRARIVASRRLFREPIHDNGVGRGLRASSA
jgi:hypothetical protein